MSDLSPRPNDVRTERARPLLEDLQRWFKECLTKLSRKSDVTVAIHYALGLWTPLLRYCNDGRLEIDNNAAERALRAVALGRKNYLFAGSDVGGERAAAMYTLIGSAKRIRSCHLSNQGPDLGMDLWSSRPLRLGQLPPVPLESLLMPAHNGIWSK